MFCVLNRYTLLKNYKLAEVTFSLEEMIDMEGNTFVNMLRTKARISSIINNSISPGKLSKSKEVRLFFSFQCCYNVLISASVLLVLSCSYPKQALAGEGERELGLHLVQFTWVILLFVEVIKHSVWN